MKLSTAIAAEILLSGGIVAYPTEGVFGLGCMPDDPEAILRLLRLKRRDPAKGLILIASRREQLAGWIAMDPAELPQADPAKPVTWIAPTGSGVSRLVRGAHAGLAVRLTSNPTAAALCDAVGSALVSTSANLSGQATVRNEFILMRKFGGRVDYIVPGRCGPATGASEIRDMATGTIVRAAGE